MSPQAFGVELHGALKLIARQRILVLFEVYGSERGVSPGVSGVGLDSALEPSYSALSIAFSIGNHAKLILDIRAWPKLEALFQCLAGFSVSLSAIERRAEYVIAGRVKWAQLYVSTYEGFRLCLFIVAKASQCQHVQIRGLVRFEAL